MSAFDYLSVLLSIVLGLGVTQLLTTAGQLIRERELVRFYVPGAAWLVLLLLAHVQTWWAMFGLRDHDQWSFATFMIILLQPILLFLQAALLTPQSAADGRVDMEADYHRQARWLFGLFILVLLVSLVKDLMLEGGLPERANVAAHALFLALAAVGLVSRGRRMHAVISISLLVLLAAYIVLLFARLG